MKLLILCALMMAAAFNVDPVEAQTPCNGILVLFLLKIHCTGFIQIRCILQQRIVSLCVDAPNRHRKLKIVQMNRTQLTAVSIAKIGLSTACLRNIPWMSLYWQFFFQFISFSNIWWKWFLVFGDDQCMWYLMWECFANKSIQHDFLIYYTCTNHIFQQCKILLSAQLTGGEGVNSSPKYQ